MWKKTSNYESIKMNDFLFFAGIILMIIGGITGETLLFIVSGLLLLYFLLNKIYDKTITKDIVLDNETDTVRLFPGDVDTLSFHFTNNGHFPYLNGRFQFETHNAIAVGNSHEDQKRDNHRHVLPLVMVNKEKTELSVPIQALKRGTSKIVNINYQFPHLFKFHKVLLSYIPFYQKEVIVYPKPLPIQGLRDFFQVSPGSQRFSTSPFEDMENRIGTRDYQYSDPFHRINWKASVKSQQLQTNTYEKVIDASLTFIINLEPAESWNLTTSTKQVEKYLSYAAFLCQYATEQHFPFNLYINVRKSGNTPYLQLPEGTGGGHYMQSLEMLARIHEHAITYPIKKMVHRIGQSVIKPTTMIIVGELSDGMIQSINAHRQMHRIIRVADSGGTAKLTPLVGEAVS